MRSHLCVDVTTMLITFVGASSLFLGFGAYLAFGLLDVDMGLMSSLHFLEF